jgi:hypothetical protein
MSWDWKTSLPRLQTESLSPAILKMTAGNAEEPRLVPRIEITNAFRTLGVYLSPSGCQKKQIDILRNHSQQYFDNIRNIVLTESEAYLSYTLYLRPKLTYPLPCCTLTPEQCRYIQAPALAALLPKLHLNRRTPQAILFAGPRYGGLNLPNLYTDQSIGQLTYLLGHLRLNDNIAKQIKCNLSHLQLQVGSSTPLFNLHYPKYS